MTKKHTRVRECPGCGSVQIGYGAMGSTRQVECVHCGKTDVIADKEGIYIERELPDDVKFSNIDGPYCSYDVPEDIKFDEFMAEYPTEDYQR